ncbi:hypothetical protein CDAR_211751 [Caerostris darwini]|uniref:Uncharacterized protein n=1 Tax=Caerostris darwini TaxID=1538125 RepID=A0AAV4PFU0_9ARAC|nr:hypothetical protein CDAR_211751 [Caerostris darwini]
MYYENNKIGMLVNDRAVNHRELLQEDSSKHHRWMATLKHFSLVSIRHLSRYTRNNKSLVCKRINKRLPKRLISSNNEQSPRDYPRFSRGWLFDFLYHRMPSPVQ